MKSKKVVAFILCILLFNALFMISAFAEDPLDWKKGTGDPNLTQVENQVKKIGVSTTSLGQLIGNIIGFFVLLLYGMKWWTSSGNSSARKELKEKSIDYVVGAVIFFGAPWLYGVVYNLIQAFKVSN